MLMAAWLGKCFRWKVKDDALPFLCDGLISTVCVLYSRKKLQLCKGHPSLCFIPSQELHGLVVDRRVALWRGKWGGLGGYLPITVLSILPGDDILGVRDSPLCSAEQRKQSTCPMRGITLAHTGMSYKHRRAGMTCDASCCTILPCRRG